MAVAIEDHCQPMPPFFLRRPGCAAPSTIRRTSTKVPSDEITTSSNGWESCVSNGDVFQSIFIELNQMPLLWIMSAIQYPPRLACQK
jgi:hypothetical protein